VARDRPLPDRLGLHGTRPLLRRGLRWLKDLYDELQPLASGFYINEFDRETRGAQTPRCFTPENWRKLQALRQKHDPERVFQSFMGVPA
jgi:FAD/FMN-containing dehydrogenase